MKRDFKGVWIPKEVWENTVLSITEKVLLIEINSLDGKAGCFASNAHFQQFLNISESTVKRSIRSLAKQGYISIPNYTETRVIKSNLKTIIEKQTMKVSLKSLADDANKHPLIQRIEKEMPTVSRLPTKMTNANAEKLISVYGEQLVYEVLQDMENWKGLKGKTSAYLTCSKWCKKRVEDDNRRGSYNSGSGMVY